MFVIWLVYKCDDYVLLLIATFSLYVVSSECRKSVFFYGIVAICLKNHVNYLPRDELSVESDIRKISKFKYVKSYSLMNWSILFM